MIEEFHPALKYKAYRSKAKTVTKLEDYWANLYYLEKRNKLIILYSLGKSLDYMNTLGLLSEPEKKKLLKRNPGFVYLDSWEM